MINESYGIGKKNTALSYLIRNPARTFIVLFLLVLSSISFYTTYDGLIRFSYGSFSQTPIVFIIVLFLFVAVLQGMLLFALFEMLRSGWFVKPLWLLVYIVTMAVSVFFSYSFYYNLFRAESYAFDNFSIQLNDIKTSAQNYQRAFLEIRNDTNKLSDYSRNKAEEERQKGGTCGYYSSPSSGPRSRYRDKEEKVFNALSNNINDLYQNVSKDIEALEGLVKAYAKKEISTENVQSEMNKMVDTLNSYKQNGKVQNLNSTLRNHMYEKRKTDGFDNNRLPITCPDEHIDFSGTAIIKQVEHLPEVREVELFNPDSDRQVLTRALTVFMQLPKLFIPEETLQSLFGKMNEVDAAAQKITAQDYSPLVLGGLIDLFIFIVGLADGIENRRNRWKMRYFKGKHLSTEDIPSMVEVSDEFLFLTPLRRHLYRSGGGVYLYIPASTHAMNNEQQGVLDLVEALEASDLIAKPEEYNCVWEALPETIQDTFGAYYEHAENRYFTMYKVTPRVWRELQQAYYSWHLYEGKDVEFS